MSYNADYTREYFAIMESLGRATSPGRRAAYDYIQSSAGHRAPPRGSVPLRPPPVR